MLTAEKTKDTWRFLLTGRKTGSIATPASSSAKAKPRGNGKGKASKAPPTRKVELDDHGMPLSSAPLGDTSSADTSDAAFRYGGGGGGGGRGGLPSHKRLPGTSVTTDAFMHTRAILSSWAESGTAAWPAGPPVFFLSHFHADHYAGLSAKWSAGTIYTSSVTASLVRNAFGSGPRVVPLPMHQRIEIPHAAVRVTLIDAHHCRQYLTEHRQTKHTGSELGELSVAMRSRAIPCMDSACTLIHPCAFVLVSASCSFFCAH